MQFAFLFDGKTTERTLHNHHRFIFWKRTTTRQKIQEPVRTKCLMNNRCWERMFLMGTKGPEENEQKFPGTKSPGNESSRERKVSGTFSGTNAPHMTFRSWKRKLLGTKSPSIPPKDAFVCVRYFWNVGQYIGVFYTADMCIKLWPYVNVGFVES